VGTHYHCKWVSSYLSGLFFIVLSISFSAIYI
jgi:hypothetical protein